MSATNRSKSTVVLLLIALLLCIGGGLLWWFGGDGAATTGRQRATSPQVAAREADKRTQTRLAVPLEIEAEVKPDPTPAPEVEPDAAAPAPPIAESLSPLPESPCDVIDTRGLFTFRTNPHTGLDATITTDYSGISLDGSRHTMGSAAGFRCTPDASGLYSIQLVPGNHRGTLVVEGYEPVLISFTMPEAAGYDGGVYLLTPSEFVHGRVIGPDGAGVEGATVRASMTGSANALYDFTNFDNRVWNNRRITTSGEDGWFTMTDLPRRRLVVIADKVGLVSAAANFTPGERAYTRESPLIVKLSEGGRLVGDVLGVTPEILAATPEEGSPAGVRTTTARRTDLEPKPSSRSLTLRMIRADDPGASRLVPSHGRVIPIELLNQVSVTITGESYQSPKLAPGSWLVSLAAGSESEIRRVEIVDGRNTREDWLFGRTGTVTGQVTRRDGSPVANATVYAVSTRRTLSMPSRVWRDRAAVTTAGADGRYKIEIGAGEWEMRVHEFEHVLGEEPFPDAVARVWGGGLVNCDIRIDAGREIPVFVRVAPIGNATFDRINALGPTRYDFWLAEQEHVKVGGDGWFDLGLKVPGVYQVSVYPKFVRGAGTSSHTYPKFPLTVPDNVQELRAEVVLDTRPLAGVFLDESGKGIAGADATLMSSGDLGGGQYRTKTGADGRFAFPWVVVGDYDLSLGPESNPVRRRVTVPSDQELRIVRGGPAGTVQVRVATHVGKPVAGTSTSGSVSLYTSDGQHAEYQADFSTHRNFGPVGSSATLLQVPVGRYRLHIWASGFERQMRWVEVTLAEPVLVEVTLVAAPAIIVWLPDGEYTNQQLRTATLTIPNRHYDPEAPGNRPETSPTAVRWFTLDEATGRRSYRFEPRHAGSISLSFTMPGYQPITWQVQTEGGQLTETTTPLVKAE